jgi:GNAT superfamily N-acetyltransferase
VAVIVCRRGIATDELALVALDRSMGTGDGRARLIADAIGSADCLVSERDDEVVGYAIMRPRHFFERDFVELLVVVTEHRREGVGRSLLRAAVAESSTSRVFTSTNASNIAMQDLLASEGWSFSGELFGLDDGDPERVYYLDRPRVR